MSKLEVDNILVSYSLYGTQVHAHYSIGIIFTFIFAARRMFAYNFNGS